jgi:hypothetical protein
MFVAHVFIFAQDRAVSRHAQDGGDAATRQPTPGPALLRRHQCDAATRQPTPGPALLRRHHCAAPTAPHCAAPLLLRPSGPTYSAKPSVVASTTASDRAFALSLGRLPCRCMLAMNSRTSVA